MGRFSGRIALVSGGTSGIGAASARRFAAEGATVIATGSNPDTLVEARRELAGIEVIGSDAADLGAIRDLVETVRSAHGRIDVVLVNAGFGVMGPADAMTEADYDRTFAVNAKGAFFLAQQAARVMPDGGAIVMVSSISHAMGLDGEAAYAASKAAMRSFGRTMASELAPRGIRVNTISPGPIRTPLLGKVTGLAGEALAELRKAVAAMVPLGRFGRPEEIAAAAAFLASDEASFITGADLPVDGGWLALGRPMH